ncbi:MAG TPA: ABC transporter ATP-binding protein [Caulobacteraceae bacterium]|nr:ABC transporter ATP-binding protein [Caulobacteraceae bacterium]
MNVDLRAPRQYGEAATATEVLSVRSIAKRFQGRPAVVDVSLDLAPGEVVGFVGPNGAGKTTTLRILAGLLRADAGSGHVLGHDLMASGRSVGKLVGYMPQRLALYPDLSVLENLRFRASVYELPNPKRAAEETIEDFELAPYARQQARSLSGGWARRLQLAATLIHRPALVLLDEPTAGLDAESRQDVWRRIAALSGQGDSLIINTHDLADAEQCTRVALFQHGRVLALGEPRALANAAPFEAAFVEGGDAHRAAQRFDSLDGVVATYVQGQGLRVLFRHETREGVIAHAEAAGLKAALSPVRLEDAAFVLAKEGGEGPRE